MLLSLIPVISHATNQNDSPTQEVYVKSGLAKQIEQLPSLIQTIFNRSVEEDDQDQKLPKQVKSAMMAAIQEAFAPRRVKEIVLAEMAEKLTPQDTGALLRWFDSPVGEKCTQLEEIAATPESQADMRQYAARLQDSPPTAERMKLLRELDSALKETENAIEMAIQAQVAVTLALMATLPKEQQKPLEEVSRELERLKPILDSTVRSQVVMQLLYTYRSLTDAEIRQYIEFAGSPTGSRFNTLVITALRKALLEGAAKWGNIIGNTIKELNGNSEV